VVLLDYLSKDDAKELISFDYVARMNGQISGCQIVNNLSSNHWNLQLCSGPRYLIMGAEFRRFNLRFSQDFLSTNKK
jgi:hypothetical protein